MAIGKYKDWITEEGLTLLAGWARDGLIDEQIAHNMGINVSTLYTWKKKYSEIDDALKVNKEVADKQVENALHQNATGFYYYEETVTNAGDVVTVKKYSKPNTTAQIYWTKNRMRKKWQDGQNIEHSGAVTNKNVDLSHLSDEQLEQELKRYGND